MRYARGWAFLAQADEVACHLLDMAQLAALTPCCEQDGRPVLEPGEVLSHVDLDGAHRCQVLGLDRAGLLPLLMPRRDNAPGFPDHQFALELHWYTPLLTAISPANFTWKTEGLTATAPLPW